MAAQSPPRHERPKIESLIRFFSRVERIVLNQIKLTFDSQVIPPLSFHNSKRLGYRMEALRVESQGKEGRGGAREEEGME